MLGKNAWVADSAQVIGKVTLEENVSVWFGTILRCAPGTLRCSVQPGSG